MHVKSLRAALFIAAALAAPAAMASNASAACEKGDFCLWQNTNRGGGLYFFSGNDSNLHNDRFTPKVLVGDNATTAENHGDGKDPSGRVDVIAYANTGFGGARLCIPLGAKIESLKVKGLPSDKTRGDSESPKEPDGTWNDDISSFQWVRNC
jgi:Peptidase inhibitor family I36